MQSTLENAKIDLFLSLVLCAILRISVCLQQMLLEWRETYMLRKIDFLTLDPQIELAIPAG